MNLFNLYKKKIINDFIKKFNYTSLMEVPKLIKIVINIGVGGITDKNKIDDVCLNLKLITGQKPIVTNSRKSIANFKIRRGNPIGCKVTLRRKLMWCFLEKLIYISIPRIRDFRGFSIKSFDKYCNLNIGIKEHTIFPEIDYEKINRLYGLDISIVTSSINLKEVFYLFSSFSFPFRKENINFKY